MLWETHDQASRPIRLGGRPAMSSSRFGARSIGPNQGGPICGIHTMHGEDVLGEIDADDDNSRHDFAF